MAAPSMTVRTMSTLSRFSRALVVPKFNSRFCTTTSSSKDAKSSGDCPPSSSETEKETTVEPDISDIEKKLQEQNEKLEANFKAIDDKYKRALAETENVRNRMKKQVEDVKLFGIQGFCKDLLEVADILDQATGTVAEEELKKNTALKSLFDGMSMTNAQLLKVFDKHGLTKVEPETGEKFDPHFHEALFEVPASEGNEGGTVAVIQKKGFKLHNRTLRPALVGVFKSNS